MIPVYLAEANPTSGWETMVANGELVLTPGKVAVEMVPKRMDSYGGILLTDKRTNISRPAMGTVIGVGRWPDPLDRRNPTVGVGDIVLCHPQDGKRINGFCTRSYSASEQVRFYGVMAYHLGQPLIVPWGESIMATYDHQTQSLSATYKNVILRLDPRREASDGGILLPDNQKTRSDIATVVSMGNLCIQMKQAGISLGDRVLFERRGIKELRFGGDDNLVLISEDAIYGKITE